MRSRTSLTGVAAVAALAVGGLGLMAHQSLAQARAASAEASVKVAVRRISESQYRSTIREIFGPDVAVNARFEPDKREAGLLAVGSSELSITSSGFEQYFSLARSISDQVLDPARRAKTVGCQPADPKSFDEACARQFIETYGEALFRRPLTPGQVAARLSTARAGAAQSGDFHEGLKLALASLLMAPDFLFRIEQAEADPERPGEYRLDGYTKAARLSFLFWDAPPDAELIAAAKSGDIHNEAGLKRQIARLSASPRLEEGARAFFVDMLQFDQFENLNKDPAAYPKFSQAVADSAREQTLKTMVDHLVAKKRDYREIFTSNETFLNRTLAAVYQVSYRSSEAWSAYRFDDASQRAGILSQVSFLSLFSHPAASSPTKRGVKVLEIFMCSPTPEPPADVDFSKVQALDNGTVRVRLLAHMDNPGCASCHRVSDPPGLALERFDGLGQLRTTENGELIDVTAQDIRGVKFEGAPGLGKYLHDHKKIPACLVQNVFSYGVGRAVDEDADEDYLSAQTQAFAAGGYRYADLLANVASSPEFFAVVAPQGAAPAPATKVAVAIQAVGGTAR